MAEKHPIFPEDSTRAAAGCLFVLLPLGLLLTAGAITSSQGGMIAMVTAICVYQATIGYLQIARLDRIERLLEQANQKYAGDQRKQPPVSPIP